MPPFPWQRLRGVLPAVAILLFLVLFALLPLAELGSVAGQRLGGPLGFWDELWGPGITSLVGRTTFLNSLEQGTLSAVLAMAWGLPVGIYLGLGESAWARRFRGMFLLPFLLPSLIMVFGVLALFGTQGLVSTWIPATATLSQGLPGILTVNVLYNVPIVALFTATTLEGVPRALAEAARTCGASRWQVARTVWLRPCLLGAALGGLLTFVLSFLSFAPPLILGGAHTYTVEDQIYIFDMRNGPLGPAHAAALAVWALVILAGPILLYLWFSRGTSLLGRGSGIPSPRLSATSGSRLVWGFLGGITAALALSELLLIIGVLSLSFTSTAGSLTLASWSSLLSARAEGALGVSQSAVIFNTLFFAVLATTIAFAMALPLFITEGGGSRYVGSVMFLPLLISPVILALGLELTWGGLLGSSSTAWILIVLSQATIALPFVLQALGLSFRAQVPTLGSAARTLGASSLRAFSDIRMPLARPGVRAATLLALAVGLGEFAATNFLYVPRFTTLSVEMYNLQSDRLGGASFAAGAVLVLLSLAVFATFTIYHERTEASA